VGLIEDFLTMGRSQTSLWFREGERPIFRSGDPTLKKREEAGGEGNLEGCCPGERKILLTELFLEKKRPPPRKDTEEEKVQFLNSRELREKRGLPSPKENSGRDPGMP